MAEIMLSAFFSVLFDKLASATFGKLGMYDGINSKIEKLHSSLKQIQDVLDDASKKEITNNSVKRWLNGLQHLAYDIDDVLDDLATEAMHRELNDESKAKKISLDIFSKSSSSTKVRAKVNDITTRLQDLMVEKGTPGLIVKEESRSKNKNKRLTTSMVDASSIVGRQAEKEALVLELLGGESSDQNFSVVPIYSWYGRGWKNYAS